MGLLRRDPLNIAEWADRGPASGAPPMACYFAYQTFVGAFLHLLGWGSGWESCWACSAASSGQGCAGCADERHKKRRPAHRAAAPDPPVIGRT
ncbi:MAG: hypothetical protein JO250_05270 [Armatimonadetes bacterium]|nr:hypothetical protein [Armatimonadota bacterium]